MIHDAEYRPTEWLTTSEILSHSSNVGAVTIAEKLGSASLMNWIEKFGYGKTTGIDFPGESPGFVLPLEKWYGSTIGNVPIGQGISVTPIQMASAYAAIANGGVWVQPHLVERVGGQLYNQHKRRRVVTPKIDEVLKKMLTGVVDEHGATGNAAAIPGYTVAGKTGTAQVPGPHGYTTGKYVASFVGMVPGQEAAARRPRRRERADPRDLRRHGRRAGVRGDREVRPAVPWRGAGPPRRAGALNDLRLTILHTNDIHGHQERLAQIATIVEREKADSDHTVLYLDAGDVEDTTNRLSNLTKGTAMHRLLSIAGCDAATVGNASWLRYGAASLTEHARASAYPQLLANFTGIDGPVPSALMGELGIVGVTDPFDRIADVDWGFGRREVLESAKEAARDLRARGATLVVLLSHLGYDHEFPPWDDRRIAPELQDDVDVIVGGHSHHLLPEGEWIGRILVDAGGVLRRPHRADRDRRRSDRRLGRAGARGHRAASGRARRGGRGRGGDRRSCWRSRSARSTSRSTRARSPRSFAFAPARRLACTARVRPWPCCRRASSRAARSGRRPRHRPIRG